MKQRSIKTLLRDMEILKNNFINTKAYFPYMEENMLGKHNITTAPYYINEGLNIKFILNQPITKKHIKNNNEISGWINQNFLIRLYALLNSYNIISDKISIDHSINGWKELDLLRRLRNIFAHTSGRFNSKKPDHKKLVNELISHFKIQVRIPNKFPIPIDIVCVPIYEGCMRYIQQKYITN
ncbi:MAG: hypothetical protein JSW00_11125 [Thermoplasmata archaeon]|nr:MAG: hypothetical protein JSW00_11125 [Thermoplasmata archaeon]